MFCMDVGKVDRDVAYVALAMHLRYKRLFQMFYLFFSDVCCKCVYMDVPYVFTHMLHVIHVDVAYVLQ